MTAKKQEAVQVVAKRKTLAEFRATYDKATIVPAKLRAAIKSLGQGGWEYEVQFSHNAGVSLSDLANFRDQFSKYVVALREGRRVWAGSPKTAQIMKEII